MDSPRLLRVALIDDDESVARSFSRLLRAGGMDCITYSSAEAFLDDADSPSFDCLVLDIQLGGISGLELGRRLAASHRPEPIIYMTAHDDSTVRAEATVLGARAFFSKADSGSAILQAIRVAATPE